MFGRLSTFTILATFDQSCNTERGVNLRKQNKHRQHTLAKENRTAQKGAVTVSCLVHPAKRGVSMAIPIYYSLNNHLWHTTTCVPSQKTIFVAAKDATEVHHMAAFDELVALDGESMFNTHAFEWLCTQHVWHRTRGFSSPPWNRRWYWQNTWGILNHRWYCRILRPEIQRR